MQADAAADSSRPFKDQPEVTPDVEVDEEEDYSEGDFELEDNAVYEDGEDGLWQHKAAPQLVAEACSPLYSLNRRT